jgi:hypothetical protein
VLSDSKSFTVVVYRPNTAPVLTAISNQVVYANTLLSFAVSATDTDSPPQTLSYGLAGGAPSGASITTNGVFSWTPTAGQAPSTNTITVQVSDSGSPVLSDSKSFVVAVLSATASSEVFLETASALEGAFETDSGASVDTGTKTITTDQKPGNRFYRLRSGKSTTITAVRVIGSKVILSYE